MKHIFSIAALLALACSAVQAATVSASITVTPTSSQGPIAPTITWTSTGAGACSATGGWSGAKPVNGSEIAPTITKTTTFGITCISPTGPITLHWTPPTTNSDGSTLTNLSGYQIMSGPTAATLARLALVNTTTATSAVVQSPPGLTFFAMRAESTDGKESSDSNVVSKTIVADSATATVTLTVAVVPNPPTDLTAQ